MEALNRKRIESGIFINDHNISFEEGKISIISGRPNTGKTCLMIEIAKNMLKEQIPVTIFSLAHGKQELFDQYSALQKYGKINNTVFEIKGDFESDNGRYSHGIIDFHYWLPSNHSIENINNEIIYSISRNRTKVFFIDYFQFVKFDNRNKYELLRTLIKELNIILICLCINEIDCHDFLKNRKNTSVTEFILENAYYLDTIINLNDEKETNVSLTAYQNGEFIGCVKHH
ncbi:MAG: DnaB-like helicase C-terminal domain-containing protein [Bacteroidales bacterium]